MRIPSGVVDQVFYIVAVDATDLKTRETGLTAFTVYRDRNGGGATVMTTPTVTEVDATNLPGLYKVLADEDMTIGAGNDSEEMVFHITHAGMAPVTRTIEVYRPKITAGQTLDVTGGAVDDVVLVATATDVTNQITAAAIVNEWETQSQADPTGFHVNVLEVGGTSQTANDNGADINTLLTRIIGTLATGTHNPATAAQIAVLSDWINDGRLDLILDAVLASVSNISTGSAAISKRADSETLTQAAIIGDSDYTNTYTLDNTYYALGENAGNIIDEYVFNVGGNGVAVELLLDGYFLGNGDSLPAEVWNPIGSVWESLGFLIAESGATDKPFKFKLDVQHTDRATNNGEVKIRWNANAGLLSSVQLWINKLALSYTIVAQSVGYAGGKIWVDTADGKAGTEIFVNGVADNKVLTFADALIIGASLGIHEYNMSPDSELTPTTDLNHTIIHGLGYKLTLGGYDYAGTHFNHASKITGICTSQNNTDGLGFVSCGISAIEIDAANFIDCSFNGSVTFSATQGGDVRIVNGRSVIAGGTTPIIDFNTGVGINHNLTMPNYQRGVEIRNFNNEGTDLMSMSGAGQLIVAASCLGGEIHLSGSWKVTNNSGGLVTIVYDDVAQRVMDALADTNELQTNQGDWLTPTGFATETKQDIIGVNIDTALSNQTAIVSQISNLNDPTAAAVAAAVAAYDMGDGRTIKEALSFLRNKWTIIGGILTVYDTDDVTVLWTAPVTTTAGDPVSGVDPV